MAGPWTISRDRRSGKGGTDLPAVLGRVGAWSRRVLGGRLARSRPRTALHLSPAAGLVGRAVTAPARPAATGRTVTGPAPAGPAPTSSGSASPAATGRAGHRPRGGIGTRWAVSLLAIMAALAVLLTWATISIATRGIAGSHAAARKSAGPLVIPAPRLAGGLPRRFGSITEPGAGAVAIELRQRFGAAGAGLLADAKPAAGAGQAGNGTSGAAGTAGGAGAAGAITVSWTSGLYGEPGHIDPATDRPAWVLYFGLDAKATLGQPAEAVDRLMRGILGRYARIGPWPVASGRRGGSANCTVAWLADTSVAVCGWASNHTIGVLAAPIRATSVAELATLLIKMRYDLQRK